MAKRHIKNNKPAQKIIQKPKTTQQVSFPKPQFPAFSWRNDTKHFFNISVWLAYVMRTFRLLTQKAPIRWQDSNNYIYRVIFIVLLLSTTVVYMLIVKDYNITWDEKIHVVYSKDIVKYYTTLGKDTTLFDYTKSMYQPMSYYGCSFDILATILSDYIFTFADPFYVRHTLNIFFGLCGVVFASLLAKYLGGWRVACMTFLFCVFTPSWFGHTVNNPKDIPFATAFIFTIYQIIRLLHAMPRPKVTHLIWVAIGIGWGISIRAGAIILIPFYAVFLFVYIFSFLKKYGWQVTFQHSFKFLAYFVFTALLGYLIGMIMWPYAQRNPIKNPLDALKNLSNVNYLHTYENFEGNRIYMSQVPWYYVPKQISLGAPLFILVGLLLLVVLYYWMRNKYNFTWIGLLVFITIFPIFWVAYKKSMVYNGWRHFLFVYLNLVIMAVLAWDYVLFRFRFRWVSYGAALLLLGLVANVGAFMVRNHPNQYVYFNELAGGVRGANGNYELDYYSNSVKEATEWLVKNENLQHRYAKVVTNNELLTVTHWMDKLTDSVQVVWTRDYERYKQDWDYAIFTTRTFSPSQIKKGYYPPVGTIKTIDVDGVPICAIVKRQEKHMSEGFKLSGSGQYAEALPHYLNSIVADSTNEEAYRMAALCMLNIGKLEDARVLIDKAMALNPEGFMAYYLKGYYFLATGNEQEAEKMFKESIKNRINNGDAHGELGNIYLNKGMWVAAIEEYKSAIGFGSNNPATITNLGIAYMQVHDYETAIQWLNLAISKNQNYIPAYENMALCFERLGDMQTAAQIRAQIGR